MKRAFTLAEVIITLGIVGIVAAMTVPALFSRIRVRQTVAKLQATQAVFNQAIKLAESEHGGDITMWDIGSENTKEGSLKLYNILKPNLKLLEDCGSSRGCFADNYKALNGTTMWAWQLKTHDKYARGILLNGTSFAIWSAGTGCESLSSDTFICGSIYVDVNGRKGPNRAGVDYFAFNITNNGIVPSDAIGKTNKYGHLCQYNNSSNVNGDYCTKWVMINKNMDYLHKPVSWN